MLQPFGLQHSGFVQLRLLPGMDIIAGHHRICRSLIKGVKSISAVNLQKQKLKRGGKTPQNSGVFRIFYFGIFFAAGYRKK
jgi:hypothetical protein